MNSITWLKIAMCMLIGSCFAGCGQKGGSVQGTSTNLAIVVWSSFPPKADTYHHTEHLQNLQSNANALFASNPAIFSQSKASGNLPPNSPLRALLKIPSNEPSALSWSQTIDHRFIAVRSLKSQQRFGRISLNLTTRQIEGAHDVEALFVISEMERRLRQIIGTREEALRLFRGNSSSPEREQATKAIASALFLPPDTKLDVRMSAPGGSNGGHGHLSVNSISSNSFVQIAYVGYPPNHGLLSSFGLSHPTYRFGGLRLHPAWTNLNTSGFLLDADSIPYPNDHSNNNAVAAPPP